MNARPRIGLVTAWCPRGAGYVSRAYRRILEPAADVCVYARGGAVDREWDADGQVTRAAYRGGRGGTGIAFAEFEKWLRAEAIDLLLFNEQQDPAILYHLSGRLPLVGYVDYYTPQSMAAFELYDLLFCHTDRHAEAFAWHPGRRVIPWSVFPEDFVNPPAAGRNIFLHNAGMLGIRERKGTSEAIAAFRALRDENARLVICAQIALERLQPGLQALVGSDPRIEWRTGTVEAPDPYGLGDVYLYPAKLDGIGLTVLEAMASGRAVIVPSVAPYSEVVRQGETGSLVRTRSADIRPDGYYWPERAVDVRHLAEAMSAYMDDPARIVSEGEKAAAFVRKERSWERWGGILIEKVLSALDGFTKSKRSRIRTQIAMRYERPRVLAESDYSLLRPAVHTLEGMRTENVLVIADDPHDAERLQRFVRSCFEAKEVDLAVRDRSAVEALRAGSIFRKRFRRIFCEEEGGSITESAETNWDLIVVWQRAFDRTLLATATRLGSGLAIAKVPYDMARAADISALGYDMLPAPSGEPALDRWGVGIWCAAQATAEAREFAA